jgi:hypothetical protein
LHGHNGQIRNGDAHYKARLDVISAQSSLAADAAKGIASGQRTVPLKPRTRLWNDYGFNQGFETIHEL